MKAVILEKLNCPLIVGDVTLTTLDVGQVLVKIITSGLCGSQLLEIKGHKNNAKFLPHLMGHEGCGEVVDVGLGVTKIKPKDRVVLHWMKTDGIESNFPKYEYKGKIITSGKVITLSEYAIVSENRLTVVPSDTSPSLCSLLGCCLTTSLGVITKDANIKMGESVLIVGCGGIGLNCIMGAKLHNAYPIFAIDISENKRSLALDIGASIFINVKTETMTDKKFDVIIDTTGNSEIISSTLNLLDDSGRYILVGQSSIETSINIINYCHLFGGKGKTIKASQGGNTIPSIDIPRYIKLANENIINVDKLITDIYPLHDINKAVESVKQGKSGRIIIKL